MADWQGGKRKIEQGTRALPMAGLTTGFIPPEGPGVTLPELVGVTGLDTGVLAFSFCKSSNADINDLHFLQNAAKVCSIILNEGELVESQNSMSSARNELPLAN